MTSAAASSPVVSVSRYRGRARRTLRASRIASRRARGSRGLEGITRRAYPGWAQPASLTSLADPGGCTHSPAVASSHRALRTPSRPGELARHQPACWFPASSGRTVQRRRRVAALQNARKKKVSQCHRGKSEGRQRGSEAHDRADEEVALIAAREEARDGRAHCRQRNAGDGLREGGRLACGQDQPGGRSYAGQG